MQIMKRGDETVILHDSEVFTLERVVNTVAMCAYDDYVSLKAGKPNSEGKEVTEDSLKSELELLNILSNALSATKK